jgi:chromate transport protein ChrA
MVPFWCCLQCNQWFKSALNGINAASISFVGSAYIILYEGAVATMANAMVFALAGTLTMVYGLAAPFVVLTGGIFGAILHEDALSLGQINWCAQGGDL